MLIVLLPRCQWCADEAILGPGQADHNWGFSPFISIFPILFVELSEAVNVSGRKVFDLIGDLERVKHHIIGVGCMATKAKGMTDFVQADLSQSSFGDRQFDHQWDCKNGHCAFNYALLISIEDRFSGFGAVGKSRGVIGPGAYDIGFLRTIDPLKRDSALAGLLPRRYGFFEDLLVYRLKGRHAMA